MSSDVSIRLELSSGRGNIRLGAGFYMLYLYSSNLSVEVIVTEVSRFLVGVELFSDCYPSVSDR